MLGSEKPLSYQRLQTIAGVAEKVTPHLRARRTGTEWRSYEPLDVARLAVVVSLCGGAGALQANGRLNGRQRLEAAAQKLISSTYGLTDPLVEVPWIRQGRDLLVILEGTLLDPLRDQTLAVLGSTAASANVNWLIARVPELRGSVLPAFTGRLQAPMAVDGTSPTPRGGGAVVREQ